MGRSIYRKGNLHNLIKSKELKKKVGKQKQLN